MIFIQTSAWVFENVKFRKRERIGEMVLIYASNSNLFPTGFFLPFLHFSKWKCFKRKKCRFKTQPTQIKLTKKYNCYYLLKHSQIWFFCFVKFPSKKQKKEPKKRQFFRLGQTIYLQYEQSKLFSFLFLKNSCCYWVWCWNGMQEFFGS